MAFRRMHRKLHIEKDAQRFLFNELVIIKKNINIIGVKITTVSNRMRIKGARASHHLLMNGLNCRAMVLLL